MKLLLVDDEKIKRTALRDDLVEAGYDTSIAASAEEGMRLLRGERFDVVVTDVRMKGMDGTTFLAQIKDLWPDVDVVMITAYATVDNAVEAMKLGAFDYITKPFESAKLIAVLDNIAKVRKQARETGAAKSEGVAASRGGLVGQSRAMRSAFEALQLAIASDVPVLICGETGTGKERFATAIHENGPRKNKPFVRVSCVALSPQLVESELFGHERGAFTGAVESKPGRFELAHQGTLFLDEIDDIPLEVQPKLLRVLEGFPFERVGGIESIHADVRFIAASKADLQREVAQGAFREDLYYRVSVFPIRIPPLRERREDIPLLADHFLHMYSGDDEPQTFDEKALAVLTEYHWPGNVRELQNVVRRVLVSIGQRRVITARDLPPEVRLGALRGPDAPIEPRSFRDVIEENEKNLLTQALDAADGNQSKAAAALGMKLSTFRDKLSKYHIRRIGDSTSFPGGKK